MSSLSTTGTNSFYDRCGRLLPGLLLSAIIAYAAIQLGKLEWMQTHGMSALTLAIIVGIILGNTTYAKLAPACNGGVTFFKAEPVRLGIIPFGFRLNLPDIGQVGLAGIAIDALVL